MLKAQKQAILSTITALTFSTSGFAVAETQPGSWETPPTSLNTKLTDGLYFVLRWHYDKVGAPAENTRCTQHGCEILYSSLLKDCAKNPKNY